MWKVKRWLFSCLLVLIGLPRVNAQFENIWVFGRNAGMDFNMGAPSFYSSAIGGGERTASICDEAGRLLFYTSGDQVWTSDHQLMPNGDTLIKDPLLPGTWPYCRSTSNATLIMPVPGQKRKYYLFSLTHTEMQQWAGRLYYSIVDMSLNNGMGDVEIQNSSILLDSNLTEHLTGVTGDRCNSWLICIPNPSTASGSRFKSYEVTGNGLSRVPVESNVEGIYSAGLQFGKIDLSPDRRKVAVCRSDGFRTGGYAVELYDFNPATGILSNLRLLSDRHVPGKECYYGVSFSPDGSKVYASGASNVSSSGGMFQFDISKSTVEEIIRSRTFIDNAFDVKLGPDGKVYYLQLKTAGSTVGVINHPNLAGLACQPQPDFISAIAGAGLGGFPNRVPVVRSDTILTVRQVSTPCFTDGRNHTIRAMDDSTGWGYLWNNGMAVPATTTDTPGLYWVSYHTPPCTYHVDTFYVAFANGVLPVMDVDTACFNATNGAVRLRTYPSDTVRYRYTWKDASGRTISGGDTLRQLAAGTYSLHIATERCDTLLSVAIPQAGYRVSFQIDSILCQGEAADFQNTSNTHYTSYHWNFDDGTYDQDPDPVHTYAEPGLYNVQLVGKGAICSDTFNRLITVDRHIAGSFHLPKTSICEGEHIDFYPLGDSSVTGLEWQFGDDARFFGELEGLVQHAYDRPGTFGVQLTTHFRACPGSTYTDTVTVYPLPLLQLGPDTVLCPDTGPIRLQNVLPRIDSSTCLWSTGDTTAYILAKHPGIYTLRLTNAHGCIAEESIAITKDCFIDIPNVFTPDGDGHNDYFYPKPQLSKGWVTCHITIWDRWGRTIFESRSANGRGWDGKLSGAELPGGVYLYRIEVGALDRTEIYTGNVTLLR